MEPLTLLPLEKVPILLSALKVQIPKSIHAYHFLRLAVEWSSKLPDFKPHILTQGPPENGDFIVYYNQWGECVSTVYVSDDSRLNQFETALKQSNLISWPTVNYSFTCMQINVGEAVMRVLESKSIKFNFSKDYVMWLPAKEAAGVEFQVPKGTTVKKLTLDDAAIANDFWPYKSENSLSLFRDILTCNYGFGVYKENQPVSWALKFFYGGIGAVHTLEEHRRKGLGSAAVLALTKQMGMDGIDVYLNIAGNNLDVKQFYNRLTFCESFESLWVFPAN